METKYILDVVEVKYSIFNQLYLNLDSDLFRQYGSHLCAVLQLRMHAHVVYI